jgi:hypothetical protein
MPATSGTFNFQSIQVELIIREAFERIGILGEYVEPQKLDSAKRSIDFLLLEWMSKSINLWTLSHKYLYLATGQGQYTLSNTVSNIIQANLRTYTRQLNGTASSYIRQLNGTPAASSGVAANAFDGNPATACTQNAADGNISYDYGVGVTQPFTTLGITSEVTRQYTIIVEYSDDNVAWQALQNIPVQNYVANTNYVFAITNPVESRAYRIRETGGATLNIQELYFTIYGTNANATRAFDTDSTTPFIDIWANGNISYDYGATFTQQLTFIGIQSNSTTSYSLTVEYSPDNIAWSTLFVIPTQSYTSGVIEWFDVPTPVNARAYRIRETGGGTLNLQEVYFTNNTLDLAISDVSRYEYFSYPNKYLQGRPSLYYLDRQLTPLLNIWPTPSPQYNCLFYSYKQMMQDVGMFYTNALQIPARLYSALVWGLAWQLAIKYKPDPQLIAMFKAEYEQAFEIGTVEDKESVTIKISGGASYTDGEIG